MNHKYYADPILSCHGSIPILLQSSPSMVSGLAEDALVSPLMIRTSADFSLILSIGHGWVVNVEDDDTYTTYTRVHTVKLKLKFLLL